MVREKQKKGRFYIVRRTHFTVEYYLESGVMDVGTSNETAYVYWTRYRDRAKTFSRLSTARRMADKLWSEYGVKALVVDSFGMVVE